MSENLDLVRSICEAWERGDYSSAEWEHPEIEFVNADGPEPTSWTGRAEIAEGMREWLSAWEDARAQADEYRELDDERILVLVHFSGSGKTSGLELGQLSAQGAFLFNVRGAKVTRLVRYFERERALADLGLEEEAVSQESVAVLRAFYTAWNAGDMDALRELHDPSVIMHAPSDWPEPGPDVGRDAVMRQYQRLRDAFEADSVELIGDYVDAGDRALMRLTWHTAGRGLTSHMEVTHVATVRDRRIIRNEYFWDYAEALKAVGLEE